ncbi:MAG: hypothetical protein U0R19_23610 [Bryobacteraceae bacterium]
MSFVIPVHRTADYPNMPGLPPDGFPNCSSHPLHEVISSALANPAILRGLPNQELELIPVLAERLDWHCSQGASASDPWVAALRAMLRNTLTFARHLDETTMFRLVRWGTFLCVPSGDDCYNLPALVRHTIESRSAALTSDQAALLRPFIQHLTQQHRFPDNFALAFRLYRDGHQHIPWAPLLPSPTYAKLSDYVNSNLAHFFRQAVDGLEAQQPVLLDAAAVTLLRQMLLWTQSAPTLDVHDALYRLCGITWHPETIRLDLLTALAPTLLATVSTLPGPQAFACVERLAQHPQMKHYREVVALYEQLLAAAVGPLSDTGQFQHILDNMLQAAVPRYTNQSNQPLHHLPGALHSHVDVAFQQASGDYPAMLRVMHERVRLLAQQEPKSPNGVRESPYLQWCCDLGNLYIRILETNPPLASEDLAELCRIDAMNWLGIAPTSSIFQACQAYIQRHGFHRDLSDAMRTWHKSVHGGATAMALRRDIGWLLWFDSTAPINEKACWSSIIQKDLRSMPTARQSAWIALLSNVPLAPAAQPSKKWLKPAAKLLKDVTTEDFRTRLRAWFQPFHDARPLKLTLPGRDMLAALLWYTHLAKDPQTDEALLWYATAKWKTQADLARTARLLPVWVHAVIERAPDQAIDAIHAYQATGQLGLQDKTLEMYEAHCRRQGRKPEIAPPPPPPPIDTAAFLEKNLNRAMVGLMGGAAQLSGGMMSVASPDGDTYEINSRDGRITRLSDQKHVRLEIDWSQPPFSPFRQMIDSADLNAPFQPNYFRAMLCAQILSGALPVQVPIIEEEA